MRRKVAWLLISWLNENLENEVIVLYEDNPLSYFARALKNLERENQQDGATYFMSATFSPENIENIRKLFDRSVNIRESLINENTESINVLTPEDELVKSLELLLQYPTRLFEQGNVDKIISRHFIILT